MSGKPLSAEEYREYKREDARLVMLRELHKQEDDCLNQTLLLQTLKAYGYRVDKNFVQTELRVMRDLGAVILHEVDGFVTAEITGRGAMHVERSTTISGILRPSRREG